jgi:hypothetical protein
MGDPTKEVPAASLTCPDYFALSIGHAVEDFKASSGVAPTAKQRFIGSAAVLFKVVPG